MNNDWIIWNGGDCPVSPDTKVQVQYRDGTRDEGENCSAKKAGEWDWNWGSCYDIIAYRVVPEPRLAELTMFVAKDGSFIVSEDTYHKDTHRLLIPVKLIDGKRVIDDSRQPVMEKL